MLGHDDYEKPIHAPAPSIPSAPLTSPKKETPEIDIERLNKAVSSILAERTARIIANILIGVIVAFWFIGNAWESEEFVMFIFDRQWTIFDLFSIIALWFIHSFVKFIALFIID